MYNILIIINNPDLGDEQDHFQNFDQSLRARETLCERGVEEILTTRLDWWNNRSVVDLERICNLKMLEIYAMSCATNSKLALFSVVPNYQKFEHNSIITMSWVLFDSLNQAQGPYQHPHKNN